MPSVPNRESNNTAFIVSSTRLTTDMDSCSNSSCDNVYSKVESSSGNIPPISISAAK